MGKTYCPGITIRSASGIPSDVRQEARRLVRWLRRSQRIEHGVILYLRPEFGIVDPRGGGGFACLEQPLSRDEKFVWIMAGAGMVEYFQEYGDTRQEAIDGFLHIILHEFVHYEQWRDNRPLTERGVNLRSANMLKRYCAATKRTLTQSPYGGPNYREPQAA